jgi:4-amino-4-deoxy-L-arabinose transferase-like glycosyltransferase
LEGEQTLSMQQKLPVWEILAGCGIIFLLTLAVLMALRVGYPYELEWMEGGAVDHIYRILKGDPLYAPPSMDFVPYIYPPVYFYLAAGLSKLTGAGLFPLRLLSILSLTGCLYVIFDFARKESGSMLPGICAAGLFAATFPATGGWFDLGRVDSLYLFLLLFAAWLIRFRPGKAGFLGAGLLLTLAFFTKQTTLIFSIPLLIYAFVHSRKAFPWIAIAFPALSLALYLILNGQYEGWFDYYIRELPGAHPFLWKMAIGFWPVYVLGILPIALLLGIWFLISEKGEKRWFYLAFLLAGLMASWMSMMHGGGYKNNLMPLYAVLAILFPLGVSAFLQDPETGRKLRLWILLAAVFQFGMLIYQPWEWVPTRQDREAGDRLIKRLSQLEGRVWIFGNGYLPRLAGKEPNAQAWAVIDVLRGKKDPVAETLEKEIRASLREARFDYVVMDFPFFTEDLDSSYEKWEKLFEDEAFIPVSGGDFRPMWIYRKRLDHSPERRE